MNLLSRQFSTNADRDPAEEVGLSPAITRGLRLSEWPLGEPEVERRSRRARAENKGLLASSPDEDLNLTW